MIGKAKQSSEAEIVARRSLRLLEAKKPMIAVIEAREAEHAVAVWREPKGDTKKPTGERKSFGSKYFFFLSKIFYLIKLNIFHKIYLFT